MGPHTFPGDAPGSPWRVAGRAPRLRVLMVASEMSPWAKTGGLADVLAGLPAALDRLGHEVTVALPAYRGIDVADTERTPTFVRLGTRTYPAAYRVRPFGDRGRIVFVESPAHFDRDGFYNSGGVDYSDNADRFGLLAVAALDFAETHGDPPDVVHAHDWQGALAPVFLRVAGDRWPRTAGAGLVLTIHNLAYQGSFPPEAVTALGLPWDVFRVDTGEFWGRFCWLKAGINYADLITTVSPTYARETQRPEFGCGLEGVLAARSASYAGILNGIDTGVWDPASDKWLPARYERDDLSGKRACKRALLERFRLPIGDDALARPLVGMVSRLADQKGIDLVLAAADALLRLDATWAIAGSGDRWLEDGLRALAADHPSRIGVFIGFDEGLAHLIEAGSDLFLMPSRFEPCGLNQMYSLRYGTVPVVHAVGGLDDTVRPYTRQARRPNGFKYRENSTTSLVRAMRHALGVFEDRETWNRLCRNGMADDHSWDTSAREYVRVYRRARLHAAVRTAGRVGG